MLVELHVRDLGVIEEASLLLGAGHDRAHGRDGRRQDHARRGHRAARGRPGRRHRGARRRRRGGRRGPVRLADPAATTSRESCVSRVVPRVGRSRAYVDGRLAPASALAELGAGLVDLHGQHAHQSLLAPLGAAAGRSTASPASTSGPLPAARAATIAVLDELALLGGDERSRARELDLLRFQVAELDAAGLDDPQEDARARGARRTSSPTPSPTGRPPRRALDAVATDDGVLRPPRRRHRGSSRAGRRSPPPRTASASAAAELDDCSASCAPSPRAIEDDPERLAAVRARRQLLHDLQRKYGDDLAEVIAFADDAEPGSPRCSTTIAGPPSSTALEAARRHESRGRRRGPSPPARRGRGAGSADAVQARLADLAMAKARLEVAVGERPPGDDVRLLLAANPGADLAPLAKVASGGELARAMLALRLVLLDAAHDGAGTAGPARWCSTRSTPASAAPAALAVGRALADLRRRPAGARGHPPRRRSPPRRHPLVVVQGRRRRAAPPPRVAAVSDDDRVVELSRMLAGHADSATPPGPRPPSCSPAGPGGRPMRSRPAARRPLPLLGTERRRRRRRCAPDRRTKDLVKRLVPGDIAVIDHEDLDRVAAESLVRAEPAAVVNCSQVDLGPLPQRGAPAPRRRRHPAPRRRRPRRPRRACTDGTTGTLAATSSSSTGSSWPTGPARPSRRSRPPTATPSSNVGAGARGVRREHRRVHRPRGPPVHPRPARPSPTSTSTWPVATR